jgi:hypothetical protein
MNTPSLIEANFDVARILRDIERHGATSIVAVSDDTRRLLIAEARAYDYKPQEEYTKSGVREQLATAHPLYESGHCTALARQIERVIEVGARALPAYPFATQFRLDEHVIQRYPAGSIGITPHRDFSDRLNLVCVLVLEGHGRFGLCDDRAGTNPRHIRGEPGDLIIMRAPGFLNSNERPMHFLDRIETERFALGMRNCQ